MILFLQMLLAFSVQGFAATDRATMIHPDCLPGSAAVTKDVTHYMVPLLAAYNKEICDVMEGTCIYNNSAGTPYLHNTGYTDVPVAQAHCQNGYGNEKNCLHPCRTIAASMQYHQFGQVVFIKSLVGLKCGNLKRDGFELVHDGYVVVTDTGSPKYFNATGRFDFFWGRCQNQKDGVCYEGAVPISNATTDSDYCTVWDPSRPQLNPAVKNAFVAKVKAEDRERGDFGAANDFDL